MDRVKPRRGPQLLVWVFVLAVFGGLALLSAHQKQVDAGHTPSRTEIAAARQALRTAAAHPSPPSAPAGGTLLAAGGPADGPPASGKPAQCSSYDEQRDFLPVHRWTSFELFTVDDAWIVKTKLFMTAIANLMFMVAALCWRIMAVLMGVGYTFDMICTAAKPINEATQVVAYYASYALIPAWLVVLGAAFRRWNRSPRHGHVAAFRMIAVFLAVTGLIFFISDQARNNQDTPLGKYTLPWAAATVQGWFGQVGSDLAGLDVDVGDGGNQVFYDGGDKADAGVATCAGLDKALYQHYMEQNGDTSIGAGRGVMKQFSQIFELSLVRSWTIAQFGEGSARYVSPAHAACRVLEKHSGVSVQSKMDAYDLSVGKPLGTTRPDSYRGFYISPNDDNVATAAWGACKNTGDGTDPGGKAMPVLKYWESADDIDDKEQTCGNLFSDNPVGDSDPADGTDALTFEDEDDLNDGLESCIASKNECREIWSFLSSWLGDNQTDRLTQGLLSMIVAFVFLFVLGPMAAGQTISSVALAGLVMVFPLSLLLLAMGKPQGKRLVKITGAVAAGDLVFSLGMIFIGDFTFITISGVDAVLGNVVPNFVQQVAEGAAPLVALLLFKKGVKLLGVGDISTMSGALSFTGSAVLQSAGERRLARDFAAMTAGLGVGRARIAALDQRSLQRRMFDNFATRAMGGLVKKGAQGWWRKLAHGSAEDRATRNAKMTAGLAGLTLASPVTSPVTAAAALVTGGAAAIAGGQAAWARHKGRRDGTAGDDAAAREFSPAGISWSANPESDLRRTDQRNRAAVRIAAGNPQAALRLQNDRIVSALDNHVAKQWGPDFDGFANMEEKQRATDAIAAKWGVTPQQLLVTDSGVVLPRPVPRDPRNGRPVFPSDYPDALRDHPLHGLDPIVVERRFVDGVAETDEQHGTRLMAALGARGHLTEDGDLVRLGAITGAPARVFIDRRLDRDAASAAAQWGAERGAWRHDPLAGINSANLADAVRMLDTEVPQARETIRRPLDHAEAPLPGGGSVLVGEIRRQWERKLAEAARVAQQTQALYETPAGSRPADFERERGRLAEQHREIAREIEDLGGSLSDALRSVAEARTLCEARASVPLPGGDTGVDAERIRQAIGRLHRQTQQNLEDQQDDLRRMIDALSRARTDAADARGLEQDLKDVQKRVGEWMRDAERDNRQVEDLMTEIQRRTRELASDPRAGGPSLPDGRTLVKRHTG